MNHVEANALLNTSLNIGAEFVYERLVRQRFDMKGQLRMTKLVHIFAEPASLFFISGQPKFLKHRGFDTHVISTSGPMLEQFSIKENVQGIGVRITRAITPLRDIGTIISLWKQLRQIRPDIVEAHMTKAGMLGMIAARLARVPVCIYHNHGMGFLSSRGVKRILLKLSERVACALAHQVIFVSHSVRTCADAEGLCSISKTKVLANGSINGIDSKVRFNPDRITFQERTNQRAELGIPSDAMVLGYVGRIMQIKGINELMAAWSELKVLHPKLHLLVVGSFDNRDSIPREIATILTTDPRVHMTGFVSNTEALYATMDVLALPSYHEGFPVVLLEAAAMALPVVASRIPGTIDAIQDGTTGSLVPPRDSAALASSIDRYLQEPDLRRRHGLAARQRVMRDFQPAELWAAVHSTYSEFISKQRVASGNVVSTNGQYSH
jgi:glycosyltransferase involved in cell wall biosynthesis